MATNYIQEGKSMYLVTITGAESGDAFVVGDYLPCVLLTDADSTDSHKATVQTEGVFSLSVNGASSAVSAGDMLYWTDKDTPLHKDSSEKPFGIALEATTHATNSIKVMLTPKATIPASVDTSDLAAGALAATTTGRAIMATDYFNAATVAAKFGTDSVNIANALDIIEAKAIVTALLGDNAVTSAKAAKDLIQVAEVTVSNAELLALVAAPKTLVAAPGENKILEFISAVYHYEFDIAGFTVGNTTNLQVHYENASGTGLSATRATTGFMDQTEDKIYYIPPVGVAALEVTSGINEALVLGLATGGNELTTGGGELHVKISYRVLDVSTA